MIEEDNENQFEDENIDEIVNKFEKININLRHKYAYNLK